MENVAIANRAGNGRLTQDELALIERVRQAYKGLCPVPCTGCRYCMPCPNGVEIPTVFSIYNEAVMYNDMQRGKMRYKALAGSKEQQNARSCVECGQCSDVCPRIFPIADWLKKAHSELES